MGRGNNVRVKDLLLRLKDQIKNLELLDNELSKTTNNGKRNTLLKLRIAELSKQKHTVKRIYDSINGNIITVTYSINGDTYQRKFINISKQEVIILLTLNPNDNIKILEIQEEFTKNSLVKLLDNKYRK